MCSQKVKNLVFKREDNGIVEKALEINRKLCLLWISNQMRHCYQVVGCPAWSLVLEHIFWFGFLL